MYAIDKKPLVNNFGAATRSVLSIGTHKQLPEEYERNAGALPLLCVLYRACRRQCMVLLWTLCGLP